MNGAVAAALARPQRAVAGRVAPRHAALAAILAGSAVLNVNRLAQNGYANTYYSAAVTFHALSSDGPGEMAAAAVCAGLAATIL